MEIFNSINTRIKFSKFKRIVHKNLNTENIFIDEENDIKIGGIGISLDMMDRTKQEIDLLSYISPEIIKGENNDEKSNIWSIGCILYELAFKKKAFSNKKYKELEHNILNIEYDLPYDNNNYDKEICVLIPKLLCKKNKRATIKEIIFDGTFKNKLIEINLFSEIVNTNLADFRNFFTLNAGIFSGEELLSKFKNLNSMEYPFYLNCKKCCSIPSIELRNNKNILFYCSKCNEVSLESIKSIVNYSSNWISNAVYYCSSKHKEKTPANIYCKNHNLFLCDNCCKIHANKDSFFEQFQNVDNDSYTPSGDEKINFININFMNSYGKNFVINIPEQTSLYETLKEFAKKINIPENFINEFIFISNEKKLDCKTKTLQELEIKNNQKILVNYDTNVSHEIIKLINLRKDICIIHDKKINLNCADCKIDICELCKQNHNSHKIVNLKIKNSLNKKDLEEFENFIKNCENKKRKVYDKVEKNIKWFKNYKEENLKDEELNSLIINLLKKYYSDLEIGQNLLFFAQILYATLLEMNKSDLKIEKYKRIINEINQFFNEQKINEYNISNFPLIIDFKEKSKPTFKSDYKFIPQIKLKFNDVEEIDKEIIDNLKEKCKEIFKDKSINIIEIKKGSLSVVIALNYLIKEKLETMNMENKEVYDIISELDNYFKTETKNLTNIIKDNLSISQKDKNFKPDFVKENLCDLETTRDELVKSIAEHKKDNSDINIFELSKSISTDDIKKFFNSLEKETKETQENLYNYIVNDVNKELENYLQIFDI